MKYKFEVDDLIVALLIAVLFYMVMDITTTKLGTALWFGSLYLYGLLFVVCIGEALDEIAAFRKRKRKDKHHDR